MFFGAVFSRRRQRGGGCGVDLAAKDAMGVGAGFLLAAKGAKSTKGWGGFFISHKGRKERKGVGWVFY